MTDEVSLVHQSRVWLAPYSFFTLDTFFPYSPAKHPDVYHPVDFPNSKSDLFLLKSQDFSFIKHNSVLKLNDIRTVSINRILYQHTGRMDLNSDTYKQIEFLALQKYFPEVHHKLTQKEIAVTALNEDKKKLAEENAALTEENKKLKEELKFLQVKLSTSKK